MLVVVVVAAAAAAAVVVVVVVVVVYKAMKMFIWLGFEGVILIARVRPDL
jgi:hypothetical protein